MTGSFAGLHSTASRVTPPCCLSAEKSGVATIMSPSFPGLRQATLRGGRKGAARGGGEKNIIAAGTSRHRIQD
jgi:hypothetical protein